MKEIIIPIDNREVHFREDGKIFVNGEEYEFIPIKSNVLKYTCDYSRPFNQAYKKKYPSNMQEKLGED